MHEQYYLKKNLIAYIGNKRNLLDLIKIAIEKSEIKSKNGLFLDLFAGSGSVSRLAKALGFTVHSNDWEQYSYIMNKAFIGLDQKFLDKSFKKLGGIDKVLDILNNLSTPDTKDRYISNYYCPKDDNKPDLENERLFYTSYNGKKIDAVRAKIAEWVKLDMINESEECLLLSLLLYEASVRSNTSGVFKGFHHGFGGTNGDALSRILKPLELPYPYLINGEKATVHKEDAVKLAEKLNNIEFDIVYLDPPYNQHQYGSNYHLLNTIALNDKPKINKDIMINGKKMNKSAIRRDWINTKSSFCYKKNAKEDFKRIIEKVKTKFILVSYSTDGIITFDDMLEILSSKGKLDIVMSEYTKYRGGKQALTTKVKNIEFVLIVNTKEKGSIYDIINIKKTLLINKINMFTKKSINTFRAEEIGFTFKNHHIEKKYFNNKISFNLVNHKIEDLEIDNLYNYTFETIQKIYEDIEYITNLTKEDEVYLTVENILHHYKKDQHKNALELFKEIPYFISKFNNKKNYIKSLKSIVSVLEMMIQTEKMWRKNNIISYSSFNKLEKVIFVKLNYDYNSLCKNVKSRKEIIIVDELKKKISDLYDYVIKSLEKESSEKEYSDVRIHKLNNETYRIRVNH